GGGGGRGKCGAGGGGGGEGCFGRKGQGPGQAGRGRQQDRRVGAESLLQGSLPGRSGLHQSRIRRQEDRRSGREGRGRQGRCSGQACRLRPLSARRGHRSAGRRLRERSRRNGRQEITPIMPEPAYRRVIVKVSGEALAGAEGYGIHQATVDRIAGDLVRAQALGVALGVVVGGGNILRGVAAAGAGLPRATADAMGMLGTVVNALVLEAAIERAGSPARTMSALAMPQVCETYERQRALRHLADGRIVVFAGGTGNPFFTTDTTAVLRAAEM